MFSIIRADRSSTAIVLAVVLTTTLAVVAVATASLPAPTSTSNRQSNHVHAHGIGQFLRGNPEGAAADEAPSITAGGPVVAHQGDELLPAEGSVELLRTGRTTFEPTLGFSKPSPTHPSGALFFQTLTYEDPDPTGGQLPTATDPTGGYLSGPEVIRTTDGGVTWTDVTPRDPVTGQRNHKVSWDPYLYVDRDTDRVFTVDWGPDCSPISWSDDDGQTWTTRRAGCGLMDHQNIFTGPPRLSSTTDYPNVVYYCAVAGGLGLLSTGAGCQKSLDGGMTWLPAGLPFVNDPRHDDGFGNLQGLCGGGVGPGFVSRNAQDPSRSGLVYVPSGQCGHPWVAISKNEGLNWIPVRVDATSDIGMAEGYGGLDDVEAEGNVVLDDVIPEGERTIPVHEAAIDGDAAGNLYYTWVARDRHVYLAISKDDGLHWSDPVRVSPPNLTEASLPALAVGDLGRVAIAYMGSENAPGPADCPELLSDCEETAATRYEGVGWTGYITVTDSALSSEPTFVTGAASPPEDPFVYGFCGQTVCGRAGDFFDVVIGRDGHAWAAFADAFDGCLKDCPRRPQFTSSIGVVAHLIAGPKLVGPLDVTIDVKPGTDDNSINTKSAGSIPVAILSSDSFDALSVDPTSVAFGPPGAASTHNSAEDIDGDGDLDLVLHFDQQQTGLTTSDKQACLTGAQRDSDRVRGLRISGCDAVNVK